MADLVIPSVELHSSWLAGAEEFEGAHIDGGGVELRTLDELGKPDGFRAFVDELVARSNPDTIEKNGGVYEDSRTGKRRYWIDSTSLTENGK
jgi:hypothetical protein